MTSAPNVVVVVVASQPDEGHSDHEGRFVLLGLSRALPDTDEHVPP
jgi:hypothetical protein